MINKNETGQSLLEVIAAVAVIMVAAVVLTSAMTNAMANVRLAKERVIAARLAQEGVEWIRVERAGAGNWENFISGLSDADDQIAPDPNHGTVYYCIDQDFASFVGTSKFSVAQIDNSAPCANTINIAGTDYIREVKAIYTDSANPVAVTSELRWNSRNIEQKVSVFSELYPI